MDSVLARVLQRNRTIDTQIDNKELAHAIKEAEKCHALLSASSRSRKVAGVGIILVQRPESQGADGVSPSPCGASVPAHGVSTERANASLAFSGPCGFA